MWLMLPKEDLLLLRSAPREHIEVVSARQLQWRRELVKKEDKIYKKKKS